MFIAGLDFSWPVWSTARAHSEVRDGPGGSLGGFGATVLVSIHYLLFLGVSLKASHR